MSKFIKHLACESCGSSDANALYSDGHTTCFSCNTSTFPQKKEREITHNKSSIRPIPGEFHSLDDRRLDAQTARKYGVTSIQDTTDTFAHIYPYYNRDGVHIANKLRLRAEKDFRWEGEVKQAALFGQNVFPAGSAKMITLVEGECDAMAAFAMFESKYPVVSVHSAGQAPRNVADNFEYLNSFENIVVCFDKDEPKLKPDGTVFYPGQEAAVSVAGMFAPGKVRILTLADAKDPNEYLVKGLAAKFRKEWWDAPVFVPGGLKLGSTMWEEISTPREFETIDYPWAAMNNMTYGIRLSEVVLLTADTGVGKTSVIKEIEHYILKDANAIEKGYGIGFLHLEEPNVDTALGLMSISANLPLHLPDVRERVKPDELKTYYDDVVNSDRVVIWDHFGSNAIDGVLAKIRHMVNLGCKYIVLDHLSILVSDQSGDERKQLDEISTKLKTLCMELNVAVIAVIHQNRAGQIRSSAGPEQIANIVMKLHREKEDPDPWRRNVTKISIQKNRFCGRTGPGVYLFYNEETGRLEELGPEEIKTYESGGSIGQGTFPERWDQEPS